MDRHGASSILAVALILIGLGLVTNSIGDLLSHHSHEVQQQEENR